LQYLILFAILQEQVFVDEYFDFLILSAIETMRLDIRNLSG